MKVEYVNGIVKLTAENDKVLVRKGEEQTLEDNDVKVIYLAKSLTADDYEEKDKLEETDKEIEETKEV